MLPAFATRTEIKPCVQWLVVSTAGTPSASPYLLERVDSRRQLVDAGITSATAYIEFAAADGADYTDPDVWAACNPALGITITDDAIKAELASLGEAQFPRSRLCQWTTQQADPVIPLEVWDRLCERQAGEARGSPSPSMPPRTVRSPPSPWHLVATTVPSTSSSSPMRPKRAGWWARWHAWSADTRPRTSWSTRETPANNRVTARRPRCEGDRGEYRRRHAGLRHVRRRLPKRAPPPPRLTRAERGAGRRVPPPIGDASAWNRRSSSVDISPLVAVTLALWGVLARPAHPRCGPLTEVAQQSAEKGDSPLLLAHHFRRVRSSFPRYRSSRSTFSKPERNP